MQPFLPPEFWKKINTTNPFGRVDYKFYPKTGHHVGTDWLTPIGTTILAPLNGELIPIQNAARGNCAAFLVERAGKKFAIEFCHLKELPKQAYYRRGDIIGLTGNSGSATTGAHLHVVVHGGWQVTKNYTRLQSEKDFFEMVTDGSLINPELFFLDLLQ